MLKGIFTLLLINLFVVAEPAECSSKEEQGASKQLEKITLAVTPWPASAPLYIAHEKGYFRDEGLDVTLDSYISGHLGLEAVLSGKADFASSGESPIARGALEGKHVVVVATICKIDRAILIIARKGRGISAPEDLRGKRIGVVATTTAHFFLDTYLATSLIDPKDVHIVDIAAENLVDALLNGEVDAVSTWAPHTIVLREKLGGEAVIFDDPSIYTMTWNMVTTQELSQKYPESIKKILRAVIRANRFIAESPDETHAVSSKNIGTSGPLFENEWENYRFTVLLDQSLILNLEDQARWMIKKEAGGTRKAPNMMNIIYADALKAVQPQAVRIIGK